jgi:hypothetical protein
MGHDVWAWLWLLGLGLFHGLNPAMGWLFAVAHGLQERSAAAVIRALGPIALGHAAAVAVVALATALLGATIPRPLVLTTVGTLLLLFTAWRIWQRARHPRTRFRATARQLVAWSFLLASAHGAGLMVAPIVAALSPDTPAGAALAHTAATRSLLIAVVAVTLHTVAMFTAMAATAWIVYRELGVEILRRAWFNVDLIWIAVLALAGTITLAVGVRELLL